MIGTLLARRYAKALFEVVKKADGALEGHFEKVSQELKNFCTLLEDNPGLQNIFYNPSISIRHKKKLLEELIQRASPLPIVANFITLLLEKGRLRNLPIIASVFEQLSYQVLNKAQVTVTAAWPLSEKEEIELKARLHQLTGAKEVILSLKTDPQLIGGMVVQVGSTVYDGSLKRQLENLKEELIRR